MVTTGENYGLVLQSQGISKVYVAVWKDGGERRIFYSADRHPNLNLDGKEPWEAKRNISALRKNGIDVILCSTAKETTKVRELFSSPDDNQKVRMALESLILPLSEKELEAIR